MTSKQSTGLSCLTKVLVGAAACGGVLVVGGGGLLLLFATTASSISSTNLDPEPPLSDWWCHGVGDVDGDGADDLCLSARFDPRSSQDAPTSWILSGRSGSAILSVQLVPTEANKATAAQSDRASKYPLTYRVVNGVGDRNGDGCDDLCVEWTQDVTEHRQIRSGRDGRLLESTERAHGSAFLPPRVLAGDLDRDGVDDWLRLERGRAARGEPNRVVVLSGAKGSRLFEITASTTPSPSAESPHAIEPTNFGAALCGTGDVDGDSVPDIVIGDDEDDTAAPNAGRVDFRSGTDGHLLFSIHGRERVYLGGALALVRDLDGDGLDDIRASVRMGDDWLLSGKTGATIGTAAPPTRTRTILDFDDDSTADVLNKRWSWSSESEAEIEVLSGKDRSRIAVLRANVGDCFDVAFEDVGDLDGDRRADVAVVGNRSLESGGDRWLPTFGVVVLFSGADGSVIRRYDRETLAELDKLDFPRIVIHEDG